MADSLCGPSNPIQTFRKEASVDRTLQRDRITSHQPFKQHFRSLPGPNTGILDAEFEAFQAGHPLGDDFQQRQHHGPGPTFQQQGTQSIRGGPPSWAADFQNLQLDEARMPPLPQAQFHQQAAIHHTAPGGWHEDFMNQHAQISPNRTALRSPFENSSKYGLHNNEINELNRFRIPTVSQQRQIGKPIDHTYDQADMERAFELVSSEQAEAVKLSSPINPAQSSIDMGSHEEIRIGSDTILGTEVQEEQKHESKDESNELAKTAGQLLENVKHDHSQKFQNSNFLSLMRQLRDREVHVEGDKFVDASDSTCHDLMNKYPDWAGQTPSFHFLSNSFHPLTLITEICKDPNFAHYPRVLIFERCGLFAGLRGDETQEYNDNDFTEENEVDGGEGKRADVAIARNLMDDFQDSIISRMKSFPMYYSTDTIDSAIQSMREGVRGHMIGLLLVLLPNIERIWLREYSEGANAFAQTVHTIAQSYAENIPNPKALARLSNVQIHNPALEDRPEDAMSVEILADLITLPSVKYIDGTSLDMGLFPWSSRSFVSAVSSIRPENCTVNNVTIDRLLSKMPNLLDFRFHYFRRVGYNYGETEGISSIMQSLTRYYHQSLEELNIYGYLGLGYPIFDEGRPYSLKQFQKLKQLRLPVDFFVKEVHDFRDGCACGGCNASGDQKKLEDWKQDIPHLVDLLPASLEMVALFNPISLADFETLLEGFTSRAARNVPNLRAIYISHGFRDKSEKTEMRAKVWGKHLSAIGSAVANEIVLAIEPVGQGLRNKQTINCGVNDGSSVSDKVSFRTSAIPCDHEPPYTEREPQVPTISTNNSLSPPPFSSLYFPAVHSPSRGEASITEPDSSPPPAFCPAPPAQPISNPATTSVEAETKAALPSDTKGQSSGRALEDAEPPPPYTEGSSPLDSFTYVMAAAGGPASLITQVQQGGGVGRPGSTLADVSPDEHITLDLRGTRFTLSRDELLTLPEFVLLSLFPNGLLPDGHTNSFHDDVCPVDYDPASLQYMLEFFRNVAQTIPSSSPSPAASPVDTPTTSAAPGDSARDMLYERAGIIVLREDLDFYAIPPKAEIDQPEMIEVKRAAGRALLEQDGIFSGLRRSEETGTTEQHLIEMLTAGLALARLRTDIKGNELANSNAVGMAQKLLLFWRKPARRCWWEGVELDNVDGVEGKLKVWIRRVWTLEMSVIGLR
ncbi:MAG: hypothetical protein Q9195_002290 [Heterodermia aff. obscurata]